MLASSTVSYHVYIKIREGYTHVTTSLYYSFAIQCLTCSLPLRLSASSKVEASNDESDAIESIMDPLRRHDGRVIIHLVSQADSLMAAILSFVAHPRDRTMVRTKGHGRLLSILTASTRLLLCRRLRKGESRLEISATRCTTKANHCHLQL